MFFQSKCIYIVINKRVKKTNIAIVYANSVLHNSFSDIYVLIISSKLGVLYCSVWYLVHPREKYYYGAQLINVIGGKFIY